MLRIEILSTPNCVHCIEIGEMLDELHIEYNIIDIMEHPEILQKYMIVSTPGVIINGVLEFTGIISEEDIIEKLKIYL